VQQQSLGTIRKEVSAPSLRLNVPPVFAVQFVSVKSGDCLLKYPPQERLFMVSGALPELYDGGDGDRRDRSRFGSGRYKAVIGFINADAI
jgi:hypothetical protein